VWLNDGVVQGGTAGHFTDSNQRFGDGEVLVLGHWLQVKL